MKLYIYLIFILFVLTTGLGNATIWTPANGTGIFTESNVGSTGYKSGCCADSCFPSERLYIKYVISADSGIRQCTHWCTGIYSSDTMNSCYHRNSPAVVNGYISASSEASGSRQRGCTFSGDLSSVIIYVGTSSAVWDYTEDTIFPTITFIDKCDNIIKNMHGVYALDGGMWTGFYAEDGILNVGAIDKGDQIEVIAMTWQGSHRYSFAASNEHILLDPTIYQSFNLHVCDYETGNPIQYVYTSAYQECVIKYSNTKNSQTNANGNTMIPFMSGSTFNINMWCVGYPGGSMSAKIPIGAQTPYRDLFLILGIGIDPIWEWEENTTETEGNDTGVPLNDTDFYGTRLAFYNTEGDLTNKINASDEYVDMEFYIHRYDGRYMTCRFERFLDGINYWLPKVYYTDMPNNFSYRKRIYNDNFTYAGMYRAHLFNYVNPYLDLVLNLEVYNDTEIQHLENLTTHVWFKNKLYGNQIDYKEPVEIVVYANSTNSTLFNINVSFWNQSTCICYELLDWADFIGADTKYYYEWNPDVEYDTGYNYTVKIHTYDGMLLGTDEVWTDNIRNNKLTIIVKDESYNNLNNSFIFLEGWGSLHTGSGNYYNTYTGLGNDSFKYKASKSGYTGHGWDEVTLDTEDKTVVYTLVSYESIESIAPPKVSDDDMMFLFFSVILFMFIAILIGGFIYVCK